MSIRTERVANLLRKDLGSILQEYQNNFFITVTTVRISPDLAIAKVYISIYPSDSQQDEIFEFLNHKNVEIRLKLASLVKHQLRKVPELQFYLDDTAEYVNKMESLFNKIKESPTAPPATGDETGE